MMPTEPPYDRPGTNPPGPDTEQVEVLSTPRSSGRGVTRRGVLGAAGAGLAGVAAGAAGGMGLADQSAQPAAAEDAD